ncbi:MAG: dihydrodipicolinate reductase C-terminal domain-containing protein [bacterium]|nr:dihydrodipicolinate reductase C-terminal domain-containing protein [bacterium]
MRVGLMGFGKAGKAVATVLLNDKSVDLVWVVRKSHKLEHRSVPEFLGIESDEDGTIHSSSEMPVSELLDLYPVDAVVDFSSQDGLDYYGEAAAKRGISIVSAISSYPDSRHKELRSYSRTTRVLWSPNITVGINFMILAAKTLQKIAPHADLQIIEEHFKAKLETSGTALKIAESLGLDPAEIKTIRAGGIIGVHEILFGFPFQTVRLRHESITREAFGNGAKFALHEMAKREIGMYRMEDLVGNYFVESNKEYLPSESLLSRTEKAGPFERIKALVSHLRRS